MTNETLNCAKSPSSNSPSNTPCRAPRNGSSRRTPGRISSPNGGWAQPAQLLCGSFTDYALPRAGDLPFFAAETDETQPCTHNPLGAKGCGESGAIGAPAAVVSALLDALSPLGVTDLEMPATPLRVWQLLNATKIAGA